MDFQRGDEVTVKGTVDYVGPDHMTVIFRGVGGHLQPLHIHASQVQGGQEPARPRGFQGTHTPAGREIRQSEHGPLPQGGTVAKSVPQPKQ
jgi:hypothetical protein